MTSFGSVGRQPRLAGASGQSGSIPASLSRLSPLAIWNGFWAEPWSFKWTCIYVFFEYVRPQQIYSFLLGPPWALSCIMAALLAFAIEGFPIAYKGAINWLMVGFSILVLLSAVTATYPEISFSRLNIYINWVVAFLLIANVPRNMRQWFLFIVLYLLWNIKMSQFGFRAFLLGAWGNGGAPGWFQNSGEFALEMCMFLPLSFHFLLGLYPELSKTKRLLLAVLPISAIASIISSGSRGGQLALVSVCLWMLLVSKRKARGVLLLAVVVPIAWSFIPESQKARFQASGEDETSLNRIAYWKAGREMAAQYPLLGVGYENWIPYYTEHYANDQGGVTVLTVRGERKVEVSHNIFIEVMSQLGYPALGLFILLLMSVWFVNLKTRRVLRHFGDRGRFIRHMTLGLDAGVVGFAVAGFFMAVAFYPFIWFQVAMAASLHVCAKREVAQLSQANPGTSQTAQAPARGEGWRSRRSRQPNQAANLRA